MKSKISCFDAGIARNLARRFWPLWAVYFAAMVVAFPLELTSVAIYSYAQANARVLECAMQSVRVAIPAGAAMAMAMFSYMYSSRSVGMICSLPLRRETMYMTALLCGLVPMLIADVIAVLQWSCQAGRMLRPMCSPRRWASSRWRPSRSTASRCSAGS